MIATLVLSSVPRRFLLSLGRELRLRVGLGVQLVCDLSAAEDDGHRAEDHDVLVLRGVRERKRSQTSGSVFASFTNILDEELGVHELEHRRPLPPLIAVHLPCESATC